MNRKKRRAGGFLGRTYHKNSLSSPVKFDAEEHLQQPDGALLQNVFRGTEDKDKYKIVFTKGQTLTREQLAQIVNDGDEYCVATVTTASTKYIVDAGICLSTECLINVVNGTAGHNLAPKIAVSGITFSRAQSKNSCMLDCGKCSCLCDAWLHKS